MRDHRDAKNMAHTLREALAEKQCKITVGESLELIAHIFGVRDWNTLSALIKRSGPPAESSSSQEPSKGVQFARAIEETLHRSLRVAADRGQSEATVEHLLLSLTEDPDATATMKACGINPADMSALLARSIDGEEAGDRRNPTDPAPSVAFQRVVQRAILDVQAAGGGSVSGAHMLVAILTEHDSAAARTLEEHGIDRARAVKFVSQARA